MADTTPPVIEVNGGTVTFVEPKLVCMNGPEECEGTPEFRMPLSGTGRSFVRCDGHWAKRLDVQEGIDRRYPTHQPSDFDPAYAGESWYED